MDWSMRWFLIFLFVNTVITIIYLAVSLILKKVSKELAWFRSVVMFLVPGVGPLLMLMGWFGFEHIFRQDVDLSDVIFSKDREREIIRTNEEKERNMVSLEEAIAVTDKEELRGLVMGIAQGDYEDSLKAISLALNSEDSETAHYAASVLQDALNDFRLKVQKGYNKVQKRDKQLVETATGLIAYMSKVLVQDVFTGVEQASFAHIMEKTAQILFEEAPEEVTSNIYETVCMRLLEIEDYEACELWCKRGMERYPNTLSSYTNLLKLYFNSDRREEFFQTMSDLKASPVIIDRETLELIRAFQ